MDYKFSTFGFGKADGSAKDIVLLGGKGANLAEMARLGFPVPPGFTIPTDACKAYMAADRDGRDKLVSVVAGQAFNMWDTIACDLDTQVLVSVRSGAPISCPGMMDTILNVGMSDNCLSYWSDKLGARAALDTYRRLIQMLGSTAYGIDSKKFEAALTQARFAAGVKTDAEIPVEAMTKLVKKYKSIFKNATSMDFPQTRSDQLQAAIRAVFDSWNNARAIEYRKLNNIPDDMGTAVTVQAMVFGNFNDKSGSGVLFTRNPSTGDNEIMGEFLANAQGEDVVAGIRTPEPLGKLVKDWPEVGAELTDLCAKLEDHYRDMMDVEFTVQDGKLFMLQCRAGKRSDRAAVKIAADMLSEGRITLQTAKGRLTRKMVRKALQPQISPSFTIEPLYTGLGAGVGVATGIAVATAQKAIESTVPCILVTHETDPDDIGGMAAAQGILTATGGATSHAAVVARGMQKPCVVGCTGLNIKDVIGKKVTIDGATGRVWVDVDVPVVGGSAFGSIADLAYHFNPVCRLLIKPGETFKHSKVMLTGGVTEIDSGVDVVYDCGLERSADDSLVHMLMPPDPVPPIYDGKTIASRADTLTDLMTFQHLNVTENFIAQHGQETWSKLRSVLEKAGFKDADMSALPPVYIVMSALEEG